MNEKNEEKLEIKELGEEAAQAVLDGEEPAPDTSPEKPDDQTMPEWASIPKGVKMPNRGCSVAFLRIPAKWTTDPARGDRWCCCWALREQDEIQAYQRSRGDHVRSVSELSKATIRIVDGAKADWSGTPNAAGSVQEFWASIGPKGRAMVRNYYVRTHTVTEEESLDFFSNHFAIVTVG